MQATLEIVLPVFGLILCGYLVGRTPLLGPDGIRAITNFVFYVAIPALLFRTMGRGALPDDLDWGIVFAYFGGCFILFAASCLLGRLTFGLRLEEQAVLAMGAVFSNTVLLGIPLVFTAFGEAGVVPMMMIVTFHSTLLIPLATVLVEVGRGGGGGWPEIVRATLAALAHNPVIVSMAAGLAWGVTGLGLAAPVDRFAELLSGAAAPCALFALGATLTGYRIAGRLGESLTLVVLKLVVHPLVVWLLARHVFAVTPMWAAIATVTAALPIGANVFVLAQKYEIYVDRSSSAMVISTALAVLSVALLLALLAPAG